jgi:hypothetical protein
MAVDVRPLRRGERRLRDGKVVDALMLVSHALPYFLVFGSYAHTLPRYAIPLLPFLALLAVLAVRGCVRLASSYWSHPRILAGTLAALVLVLPVVAAVKLALLRSQPDSHARAARWLEEHVDPASTVYLTPGFDLPLVQQPEGQQAEMGTLKFPWQRRAHASTGLEPRWRLRHMPFLSAAFRNSLRQDPVATFLALDADYVVMASFWDGEVPVMWRKMSEGLSGVGVSLVSIAPIASPGLGVNAVERISHRPLLYENCTLLSVLSATMVGPVIHIYRLSP